MSEAYAFLKECGAFFVITDNNGFPSGRPFDSLIEIDNDLIIGVTKNKEIYHQLKRNSRIQIVSLNKDNSSWIRINGFALEEFDIELKKKTINSSEYINKLNIGIESLSLFKIEVLDYKIHR